MHENRAAAEMVQRADEEKLGANAEFAQGRLELAVQGWATAIQMLVAAERDHGDHFGAALEVRARFQSSSGVLHCGLWWLGILVGCVGWAVSRDELRVVWQVSKMSITKACLLNQAAAYLRMGQHHSYQRAVEACSVVLALPTTLGEWFLTVGCWRQARGSLGRSGGRHLWRARVYWGGRWIRWDGVVVLTCAHYQATAPVPRHTSDGVRLVSSWGCWMRRVWTWRRRHGSAAGASRCCNYFDM